ncbi:hypothetical protein [Bradyrhizobium niftali]|uniref:Uncharacterized protein n=1 Tax=Bradyrhizobium niftali TaxID=2560055 RepID=A0A4Y9LZG3_9BRAD|nr:hypothetical protein [Bradyrhizobium niftali]TFV48260.1 hypothetical protein E4K65_12645 [Bradyrhizobium niftali]
MMLHRNRDAILSAIRPLTKLPIARNFKRLFERKISFFEFGDFRYNWEKFVVTRLIEAAASSSVFDRHRFIRRDMLEPGDVLLTRAATLQGFGIATATVGRFSHASLWLPFRSNEEKLANTVPDHGQLLLAEADSAGIGFSHYGLEIVELVNGQKVTVVPVFDVSAAILLRHPSLKARGLSAIFEASDLLQKDEFHLSYSSLPRLADAVNIPKAIRPFIRRTLRKYETPDETTLYGSFCSELVAKFFKYLGLTLLDDNRLPEKISPNDLNRSRLKSVADAVLSRRDLIVSLGWSPRRPTEIYSREKSLGPIVRWRAQSFHTDRQIAGLIDQANKGSDVDLRNIIRTCQINVANISDAIALAEQWSDWSSKARFEKYLELLLAAEALLEEVIRRRYGRTDVSERRKFNLAEAKVKDQACALSTDAMAAFNRTQGLMAIRHVRVKMSDREEYERHRRKILAAWASGRKTRALVNPMLERLREYSRIDPPVDLEGEIAEIIASAFAKAGMI